MKKYIIPLCLVVTVFTAVAASSYQAKDKSLANVERVLGKYVFVMSEPSLEYEVVDEISTVGGTMLTGRGTIAKQIENMVKRANKRAKKDKIEGFDAILTKDGDRAVLIKFTEN